MRNSYNISVIKSEVKGFVLRLCRTDQDNIRLHLKIFFSRSTGFFWINRDHSPDNCDHRNDISESIKVGKSFTEAKFMGKKLSF
jgi:hypothetical protein